MKIIKLFVVVAMTTTVFISCDKIGKGKKAHLKSEADSASYYLGLYTAMNIKQTDIQKFNMEAFSMAVNEVLSNKDYKFNSQEASMFLNRYFTKLQSQVADQNLKEGLEFLAKNKTRSGVVTTSSGLQYEVIKEGTGPKPKADDEVSVQFKGTLLDGTVFDSSYDRGQPFITPLNRVIPGWTEVLQLMKVGSKYKVYVPTELAYGQNPGRGKIKPNMALIFEMELLSIEPKKPEAASAPGVKAAKK
jgi:FKBP-type peptidyl-prolyl cis-trans isomerase FklB